MRALLCSLDSPGFLSPAIGLAAALRARGHHVAFAANRRTEAKLAGAGFARLPRGPRDGPSFETGQWSRPFAAAMQLKHVEHALAVFAPDVVVGQALTLGPLLARERHGIPMAVLGPATHLWPGGEASSAAEERRAWRQRDMLRAWDQARALVHLPQQRDRGAGGESLLGDLFLLRSIRELHGAGALPPRAQLVGACLWQPGAPDDATFAWTSMARRAGAPVVWAHHRSTPAGRGFWLSLAAAAAGLGLRVAGAVGQMDLPREETSGAGAFLLKPTLEQSWVLPFADLMIGSASSAAVLGALSCGVPCLLAPSGGEQEDLAEQVERAGAGRILTARDLTPAGLSRAIAAILSDAAIQRQARALEHAFARLDGFALAADLLEGVAGAQAPATARGA
jgi:UDP:flavonoid glycosyltransferase YjiC (YdhE family)